MKTIDSLSKKELLGLIYHHIPNTLTGDHICICASCGDSKDDKDKEYPAYYYVCDQCQNDTGLIKLSEVSITASDYINSNREVQPTQYTINGADINFETTDLKVALQAFINRITR